MKREKKLLDATPSKRLFWSIISDYDVKTAICELIDNAIDLWMRNGRTQKLTVSIQLDFDRQLIGISDDAGGVPEEDLRVLISPGETKNEPNDSFIGFFGVGSKRAVIALAEDIEIRTRHGEGNSFLIDIDSDWLSNENWDIPVYEVDGIPESSTLILLSKLNMEIDHQDESILLQHIGETYSTFLGKGNLEISVNRQRAEPATFDNWAYPPGFEPRCYLTQLETPEGMTVSVEMVAGLIRERDSGKEEYGVYFYCNDRLIKKSMKDPEVGYITGKAGIPHPDASIARVIVKLHGAARLMPWNSSKSAVNFFHQTFKGLRSLLEPVVTDYTSLSRRLKDSWEENVFAHANGEIEYVDIIDPTKVKHSHLPPLPRTYKHRIDHLKSQNKLVVRDKPWTLGLLEAFAAVDIIRRQKLETKNRIALILIDSSFEIGLKEYIVHVQGLNRGGKTLEDLFKNRGDVIRVVLQKATVPAATLERIKHYYQLRNKLVHERATVDVTNDDIMNFMESVQEVLTELFDLQF